jgi:hypothetical protein
MKAKEKSQEIVDLMMRTGDPHHTECICFEIAKRCALIAVDEVIKSLPSIVLVSVNGDEIEYPDREKYWQQVKKEIEQL